MQRQCFSPLPLAAFATSDGGSPAIDAGNPVRDYQLEPDTDVGYHGRRVNIGGYGGTPWATMSRKKKFIIIVR